MHCRICGYAGRSATYRAREMMYGRRDVFTYFECARCGCLQISEFPSDISQYYPREYYSYKSVSEEGGIRRVLRRLRDRYAVLDRGLTGRLLSLAFPMSALRALAPLQLGSASRILDVGCGSGALLMMLGDIGFTSLLGVDPFIEDDIVYPSGLKVRKACLREVSGRWDVIMFHHSLEHIPDQLETLRAARDLLDINGTCLIRVPTVSSFAWKQYGVDWVQLDAPRHYFLHSRESIRQLAKRCGFSLDKIIDDSDEFQFWGSEQYTRDIHLSSQESYLNNPRGTLFTRAKLRKFRKRAVDLNRQGLGDQACFYLKPATASKDLPDPADAEAGTPS